MTNPKRGEYWRGRNGNEAVRILRGNFEGDVVFRRLDTGAEMQFNREVFTSWMEPYPEYPADRDEAVNRIEVAREAERIALELAKEQGKRLWAETRDKYRPAVSEKVQEALALGVPKSRIQRALGSKNFGVVELYAEASKN